MLKQTSNWNWFAGLVILHGFLLALFFWARAAKTEVSVIVEGSELHAYVNGAFASTLILDERPQGRIGLYQEFDRVSSGAVSFSIRTYPGDDDIAEISFGEPRVTSNWTQHPWPWQVNWFGEYSAVFDLRGEKREPKNSFTMSPYKVTEDLQVDLTIHRGQSFGIAFLERDEVRQGNDGKERGVVFLVRPTSNDSYWFDFGGRGGKRNIPGKGYRFTPSMKHSTQSILYFVLINYFCGLMWFGFLIGSGLFVVAIRRPLQPVLRPLGAARHFLAIEWKEGWASDQRKVLSGGVIYAVILALFFVCRLINTNVLGGIPHVQDSISTLFQAKVFAGGEIAAPVPEPFEAFDFEMIIDRDGKWFTKYTIGHSLVLAPFVLIGRDALLGPTIAALTAFVLFLIAREVMERGTGWIALLLLAFSPQFLFMSASYMSHTTSLFWVTLAHYLLIHLMKKPSTATAVLMGLSIGMLGITRPYTGLLSCIPIGLVVLVGLRKWRGKLVPHLSIFVLAALPLVVAQLAFNHILIGEPLQFGYQVYWHYDRLGFGRNIGAFGGHSPLKGLHNVQLNIEILLPLLHGWPVKVGAALAILAVVLPVIGLARRNHWDWLWLGGFMALAVGYFFWWYHGIAYGARFWYEGLGCLILLSARGVECAADAGKQVVSTLTKQRTGAVQVIARRSIEAALIFVTIPEIWWLSQTNFKNYNFADRALLDLVEEQQISNAVVFVDKDLFWSEWGVAFSQNSPWLDTDIVYARNVSEHLDRRTMSKFEGKEAWFFDGSNLNPYWRLEGAR